MRIFKFRIVYFCYSCGKLVVLLLFYIFKKFCGLRNGTVEAWGLRSLQREMALTEQEGSVQVRKKIFLNVGTVLVYVLI